MNMLSNHSMAAARQENSLLEYLLVGCPDAAVYEKIMDEKQQFCNEYCAPAAVKARPHISIADFMATEAMEATIIKWMQRIFGAQQRFMVTLNNYSGFPPHTIYLRVQDPLPFQQMAKQLRSVDDFIRASACPPARLISRPYLSIARKLPEQVYSRAIAAYALKTFHESFMLDELVLLKRRHQFDACKTVQVFRLRPADANPLSDVA